MSEYIRGCDTCVKRNVCNVWTVGNHVICWLAEEGVLITEEEELVDEKVYWTFSSKSAVYG
jgi:hypothetical protein